MQNNGLFSLRRFKFYSCRSSRIIDIGHCHLSISGRIMLKSSTNHNKSSHFLHKKAHFLSRTKALFFRDKIWRIPIRFGDCHVDMLQGTGVTSIGAFQCYNSIRERDFPSFYFSLSYIQYEWYSVVFSFIFSILVSARTGLPHVISAWLKLWIYRVI